MPYTDAAIKEALRLGAIINIVPKRALKTFEIGGYTIPKVTTLGTVTAATRVIMACQVQLRSHIGS